MVCSLYTPGIEYVEPALLSGVTLDCVSASRWGSKVSKVFHKLVGIPVAPCVYNTVAFCSLCSDVSYVKMSSTVRLECASDVTQDSVKTSSMPPGQTQYVYSEDAS